MPGNRRRVAVLTTETSVGELATRSPRLIGARGKLGAAVRVGITATLSLWLAVLNAAEAASAAPPVVPVRTSTRAVAADELRLANFGTEKPSVDARHVADWIADSRDNAQGEFFIVDKRHAKVYVFDRDARLQGATAVLLGSAVGDDSVPGIGLKPLAAVKPAERTTPAGRFVAERGRNTLGEDVVWVDYDAAVSMHRVRATVAKERRLERLATVTAADNRISYGCINVPVAFYNSRIKPVFAKRRAIVYVLPEIKTVEQVFGSYDVAAKYRTPTK